MPRRRVRQRDRQFLGPRGRRVCCPSCRASSSATLARFAGRPAQDFEGPFKTSTGRLGTMTAPAPLGDDRRRLLATTMCLIRVELKHTEKPSKREEERLLKK